MRLHVLSDIHLEFTGGKYDYEPPECDVVICAGDISPGVRGIMWAAETYGSAMGQDVIYCSGNHEFYGKRRIWRHYEKMQAKANDLRVHFLQNSTVVIDEVRFIGCTLWTDFNLQGDQPLAMIRAHGSMNDYKMICYDINRMITPRIILNEYEKSFKFLQEELEKDFDGPTVVVTHHAPSELSCAEKYKTDPMNSAYASRLDKFIEIMQPTLWVHGHVHEAKDYMIGNTRVVINPRGYVGFENTGFDPGLIIEV